ncbi:MAG: hypothetical protein RLZ98_3263 [Pseudomonadota bacterium]|jgi:RimJ/RimL family protein N-acetyltransferase
MTGGAELQTARLLLRPLTTRDAEAVALHAGDFDVARMTARIPHPYSITEAFRWISSIAEEEFVRGIAYEGDIVGVAAYARDGENASEAEIGYWIGKPFWGQGIATEAAHAVALHAFDDAGLKRLTSSHFTDNPASGNVLRKLGFRQTGKCKVWCQARLQEIEAVQYDLVRRRLKRLRKR